MVLVFDGGRMAAEAKKWRVQRGTANDAGAAHTPNDRPAAASDNVCEMPRPTSHRVPNPEQFQRLKSEAPLREVEPNDAAQEDPSADE
jgi:hypothetical protein